MTQQEYLDSGTGDKRDCREGGRGRSSKREDAHRWRNCIGRQHVKWSRQKRPIRGVRREGRGNGENIKLVAEKRKKEKSGKARVDPPMSFRTSRVEF